METPNLIYIKELSGGDKAFEEKLIKIIKLEFPQEKEMYHNNFKIKNYLSTARNVHKLKHKISIFGLDKSYKIARDYENNLIEENISLRNDFEDILENITDYLNQI